ncbi:MAG: 2-succinyl-5-enolpyruvyl-6-hydroxy-3-cyclohexene-1-carboxylate synthase, partial [Phycicoccus sp.]
VVTTSGTAVVNLHPAVLEAHHAGVPLVVLSADRPHELRGTGANQTTTQPGVFGRATRFDADLPAPDRRPGQQASWRSTVCRALAAASGMTGVDPGPVHLNLALREPLVPDSAERREAWSDARSDTERGTREKADGWPEPLDGRAGGAPWVEVRRSREERRGTDAATPAEPAVAHVERTLVVVGDGVDTGAAVAWAAGRGYPVVAEPFGSLDARAGALPHGPLLLTAADWFDEHLPERVVVIGRVTLARPIAALLRRAGVCVEIVTGRRAWADPSHVASAVHPWSSVAADLADLVEPADLTESANLVESADSTGPAEGDDLAGLTERTGADGSARPGDWARAWGDAGRRLAEAVAAQGFPWPSGLAVAAIVTGSLLDDAALVLGSSNPVRDVDLAGGWRRASAGDSGPGIRKPGRLRSAVSPDADGLDRHSSGPHTVESPGDDAGALGVQVLANRGLAGIDGVVSTATGVGLAQARPTYALLGDLTFLHDANGLLIGPDEPRPDLTLVVVNDDGGGIFTTLEPGAPGHAPAFERLFGTPTGTDLEALCRAHGIRHDLAESPAQLATLVAERPTGIRVVEVRVDRARHRATHEALRDLAARTLPGSAPHEHGVATGEAESSASR